MEDFKKKYCKDYGTLAYRCWSRCMLLGEKTGCHQRPDRSFYIKGYQIPVCARCLGVILGYLIAVLSCFYLGFSILLSIGSCLVMLFDWTIQSIGLKSSTNRRRLITGILGGYGIMSIQIYLLKFIIDAFYKNMIKVKR